MIEHAIDGRVPAAHGRVLLVDDDDAFRRVVSAELTDRGFGVDEVSNGSAALAAATTRTPDAVLLDLGLPDMSGLDLLSSLHRLHVPVIVLSGRGGEVDVCVGLENGADDYLVKPFSFRELAVRLNHAISRSEASAESTLERGSLRINLDTREVYDGNRLIDLTAKEFDLLALLASAPRRVFSRSVILENVWDSTVDWHSSGTISEHVHRLRRKLDPDARSRWIQTVRGLGYRFITDGDR